MLLRRPIGVWLIFAYSIYVIGYCTWALASMPSEEYTLSFFIAMIPAFLIVLAGALIFALSKWAIPAIAANIIFAFSFFAAIGVQLDLIIWLAALVMALAYAIWLRRAGVLN